MWLTRSLRVRSLELGSNAEPRGMCAEGPAATAGLEQNPAYRKTDC